MATGTLPRITSAQQVVSPFVVHSACIPDQITQFEIAALLSLRNRARHIEQQIANAEESIRARLGAGAAVEAGEHTAEVKESFRRNVSWKDVVIRLADRLYGEDRGEAYCANVLQNTEPQRTVSLILQ
jgi:hypothetical protein